MLYILVCQLVKGPSLLLDLLKSMQIFYHYYTVLYGIYKEQRVLVAFTGLEHYGNILFPTYIYKPHEKDANMPSDGRPHYCRLCCSLKIQFSVSVWYALAHFHLVYSDQRGWQQTNKAKSEWEGGVAVLGMQLVRTFIIRTVVWERNASHRVKYGTTLGLGRQNWIYWRWCVLELRGCFIYTHNKKFLVVA